MADVYMSDYMGSDGSFDSSGYDSASKKAREKRKKEAERKKRQEEWNSRGRSYERAIKRLSESEIPAAKGRLSELTGTLIPKAQSDLAAAKEALENQIEAYGVKEGEYNDNQDMLDTGLAADEERQMGEAEGDFDSESEKLQSQYETDVARKEDWHQSEIDRMNINKKDPSQKYKLNGQGMTTGSRALKRGSLKDKDKKPSMTSFGRGMI